MVPLGLCCVPADAIGISRTDARRRFYLFGLVFRLEYVKYDRFCHPLYKYMPSVMTQYMVIGSIDDGYGTWILDFESTTSLSVMALSQALDLLGHPLLADVLHVASSIDMVILEMPLQWIFWQSPLGM